jgi:hypothetical protein
MRVAARTDSGHRCRRYAQQHPQPVGGNRWPPPLSSAPPDPCAVNLVAPTAGPTWSANDPAIQG